MYETWNIANIIKKHDYCGKRGQCYSLSEDPDQIIK